MRQADASDSIDVEGHAGSRGRFAQDLADRMRTVDQEPGALGLQRQARRVIASREGVAHAERDKAEATHGWFLSAEPGDASLGRWTEASFAGCLDNRLEWLGGRLQAFPGPTQQLERRGIEF